jgi:hypothetical protein
VWNVSKSYNSSSMFFIFVSSISTNYTRVCRISCPLFDLYCYKKLRKNSVIEFLSIALKCRIFGLF